MGMGGVMRPTTSRMTMAALGAGGLAIAILFATLAPAAWAQQSDDTAAPPKADAPENGTAATATAATSAGTGAEQPTATRPTSSLTVGIGRSTLITAPLPTKTVSIGDPRVADVQILEQHARAAERAWTEAAEQLRKCSADVDRRATARDELAREGEQVRRLAEVLDTQRRTVEELRQTASAKTERREEERRACAVAVHEAEPAQLAQHAQRRIGGDGHLADHAEAAVASRGFGESVSLLAAETQRAQSAEARRGTPVLCVSALRVLGASAVNPGYSVTSASFFRRSIRGLSSATQPIPFSSS